MEVLRVVTLVVLMFVFSGCVTASLVKDCNGGKAEEVKDINISPCEKPPCKLKRKTSATIEMKFKPETDIKSLKNNVYAQMLGLPFPFIGVDGTSVCGKIFDASTGAKVACPLKQGQEYIYRDEFKILEIYPKIKFVVHWALKDEANNNVMCFEVPARII